MPRCRRSERMTGAEAGGSPSEAGPPLVIERVHAHPLQARLPKTQRTSQGDYATVEILVVEVETRDGLVGIGEGLARRGARAYAGFVDEILAPSLIGRS